MDVGLGLGLVRVLVGVLIAGHGVQKLTTWVGGHGIDGHASYLKSLGYHPARPLAVLHGAVELIAGVLLALGLATPLAAAMVLAVMINAMVAVHAGNGLWVQDGGIEYPLVLAVISIALAIGGPGAYALDTVLGVTAETSWSLAAIAAGVLVGVVVLLSRRFAPARRQRLRMS